MNMYLQLNKYLEKLYLQFGYFSRTVELSRIDNRGMDKWVHTCIRKENQSLIKNKTNIL